jgi:hypothetical protein
VPISATGHPLGVVRNFSGCELFFDQDHQFNNIEPIVSVGGTPRLENNPTGAPPDVKVPGGGSLFSAGHIIKCRTHHSVPEPISGVITNCVCHPAPQHWSYRILSLTQLWNRTNGIARYLSSQLEETRGTTVYDPQGNNIGSIKRLMIEKISGRVAYAVMSFGGLLGVS